MWSNHLLWRRLALGCCKSLLKRWFNWSYHIRQKWCFPEVFLIEFFKWACGIKDKISNSHERLRIQCKARERKKPLWFRPSWGDHPSFFRNAHWCYLEQIFEGRRQVVPLPKPSRVSILPFVCESSRETRKCYTWHTGVSTSWTAKWEFHHLTGHSYGFK